jgi:hypothetical protein
LRTSLFPPPESKRYDPYNLPIFLIQVPSLRLAFPLLSPPKAGNALASSFKASEVLPNGDAPTDLSQQIMPA